MIDIIIQTTTEIISHLDKKSIINADVVQGTNPSTIVIPVKKGYGVEIRENKQMLPPELTIDEGINEPPPITARITRDTYKVGALGNVIPFPPETIWHNSGPLTQHDLDTMVNIINNLPNLMYIQKYPYKELSRQTGADGKRLYETPDGNRVPSVTTILAATQPEEKKQALNNWRKAVGVERAQAITTDAANRGTRMHKYLEDYTLTGAMPPRGSNPFSFASHAMANTIIEDGLKNINEVWGIEAALYYPGIYAGTTDGCGIHSNDEAIFDYKQSNKEKKLEYVTDYFLQLAAYAEAHNSMFGTTIKKGVVMMAVKPEVDKETMEPLHRPKYQEFILEGANFEYYRVEWWKRVEQYYLLK